MADECKVVAAALRGSDGKIYTLPRPARHCDVIAVMITTRSAAWPTGVFDQAADKQGFITNRGNFVSRHEAWCIAVFSGQVETQSDAVMPLFTEDLW